MQHFWDKVKKTENCWLWIGTNRGNGYGCLKYKGKMYQAHRFSWYLTYGKFPKEFLLHKCDNPLCVNVLHLFEGNAKDNVDDMIKKGRNKYIGTKGEDTAKAKLTEKQVLEIRKKYIPGIYGSRQMHKQYGVTRELIQQILHRKIWKHI